MEATFSFTAMLHKQKIHKIFVNFPRFLIQTPSSITSRVWASSYALLKMHVLLFKSFFLSATQSHIIKTANYNYSLQKISTSSMNSKNEKHFLEFCYCKYTGDKGVLFHHEKLGYTKGIRKISKRYK